MDSSSSNSAEPRFVEIHASRFPRPGSRVTVGEAIAACDDLERQMVACVFGGHYQRCVRMYELMCQIDGAAMKYGLDERSLFVRLHRQMQSFTDERTALANGPEGERFHLCQDEDALAEYDATHHVTIHIDGEGLARSFLQALGIIGAEAQGTDDYADTYALPTEDAEAPGIFW